MTPVDLQTDQLGTPIPAGADSIAITPDGRTAYALNANSYYDDVTPINVATNTAQAPIQLPSFDASDQLAITPDGRPRTTAS